MSEANFIYLSDEDRIRMQNAPIDTTPFILNILKLKTNDRLFIQDFRKKYYPNIKEERMKEFEIDLQKCLDKKDFLDCDEMICIDLKMKYDDISADPNTNMLEMGVDINNYYCIKNSTY